MYTTLAFESDQPLLKHLDPLAKQAAVSFELGLAGAAQSDSTLLTLQMGPAANQPGRQMIKLRQFNLQLALGALCSLCKDIENQAGPVNYTALQYALDIAFLGGG